MGKLSAFLLSRFVIGQPRRWLYFALFSFAWKQWRRLSARQPEVVYQAKLRRGERFDLLTDKPLPGRFQTRRRRRRVAAAALAELQGRR